MSLPVLIIAHGSPNRGWTRLVERSIQPCRKQLDGPVHTAYLGDEDEQSLVKQVKRLEQEKARTSVAVPLFVSAGSTHIGEIRQLLGMAPEYPLPESIPPLTDRIRFLWCPPLEDHPLVIQIVLERLKALSTDPRRESLLLVGHGSDWPGYRQHWEQLLQRLANHVRRHVPLAAVGYATLRPDTVATRARELAAQGTLLVLPLFLSPGYFTHQAIPQRLAGIPHRYRGEAYAPHRAIGQWIVQSVQHAVSLMVGAENAGSGESRVPPVEYPI